MYATYLVPAQNTPRLTKKLDALAKKAKRLGCAAVLYSLVHTFTRPHEDAKRAARGELVAYDAITVQGEAPTLGGWAFAATLDHVILPDGTGANILRSHSDETLPIRYRTAEASHCDHCQTSRRRKATFVVRHAETGEWKQVGRSCLKDFLGFNSSPARLAAYAATLVSLDTALREDADLWGADGGENAWSLRTFLAWTLQGIDDQGWISRSKAREDSTDFQQVLATADAVIAYLSAKSGADRRRYALPKPTEATYREVGEALAWLAAQDAVDSDYLHNCQTIAALDVVTWKTAGYAASIVSSHRRVKERQLYKQNLRAQGTDHVGTEGQRGEFWLTLLKVIVVPGDWGTGFLHKFADPDGNSVAWFASNPNVVPAGTAGHDPDYCDAMTVGATYRTKATVRRHNHYNDQPETQVNRVAVQPLAKAPRKRRARKTKVA